MKEKKQILLYGILAIFLAYGVVVTLQMKNMENRVRTLEKYLAGDVALHTSDFVITLTKDQQIEVQGAKLSLEELKALISAIPNSSEKAATIRIYGGAGSNAVAAQVLASCRKSGFKRIKLMACG